MKALRSILRVTRILVAVPLCAACGAWFLVRGFLGAMGRAGDAARLLGTSLPCPSCRAANPLTGRFRCRGCGATYHGNVVFCALCHAPAGWFACSRCGVSIPLRGRR